MDSSDTSQEENISGQFSIGYFIDAGCNFVTSYGWFIIIGLFVAYFIWTKFFAEQWNRTQASTQNLLDAKKFDNAKALAREEALLAARQRMQEKQNELSVAAKEKMKKDEEEKRRRRLAELQQTVNPGNRNVQKAQENSPKKAQKEDAKKPSLRPTDYNPLMGSGPSGNFRPGRRGTSGGG